MRFVFRVFLLLTLVVVLLGGWWVWRSPDVEYELSELVFAERFHRYDSIIQDASKRQGVDPLLIKAVIWRESRFRPDKEGTSGERGLMQVSESAASEWAKSEKIGTFLPNDLFDPKTNIEAGTWLLARALNRWKSTDNPVPFALAEYNAGHSRVLRWVEGAHDRDRDPQQPGNQISGADLQAKIGFPATRQYVEAIQNRRRYYQQRGRM